MKKWKVFLISEEECRNRNGSFQALSVTVQYRQGICRLLIEDDARIQGSIPPIFDPSKIDSDKNK